jgi:hypothetical protein
VEVRVNRPCTFVDGVEHGIAAKDFAGDRDVDVAAGQIGSQALRLGLVHQVVVTRFRWFRLGTPVLRDR